MQKTVKPQALTHPEVTTGPITGSSKIYDAPAAHPDILVPFRQITLQKEANEPPFQIGRAHV